MVLVVVSEEVGRERVGRREEPKVEGGGGEGEEGRSA